VARISALKHDALARSAGADADAADGAASAVKDAVPVDRPLPDWYGRGGYRDLERPAAARALECHPFGYLGTAVAAPFATEERTTMPKTQAKAPNAIDLLKQDHDNVKKAFKQFEKMDRSDVESCRELIERVCAELRVHTTLEEEIVYPALREAIEDEDLMNEAAVEHETAKRLIEQLENMEASDPNYFATFTVLGEYVMHHVEEEEGEMFPQAKKAKKLDFAALGEQLQARKKELTAEMEQA
jgi:hemerythrin superfamily protein